MTGLQGKTCLGWSVNMVNMNVYVMIFHCGMAPSEIRRKYLFVYNAQSAMARMISGINGCSIMGVTLLWILPKTLPSLCPMEGVMSIRRPQVDIPPSGL
jgi:hypothetical protein